MCSIFGGGGGGQQVAQALPAVPPPPVESKINVDEATPVETDINPKIQKTQSEQARNPNSKGTGALKIALKSDVNVGGKGGGPAGGLNA
tara:strand:+ start:172 stop:438 length:267 start_codon:yes stop_codon:yes gene_type:complete